VGGAGDDHAGVAVTDEDDIAQIFVGDATLVDT
jgi:hypothetical protein